MRTDGGFKRLYAIKRPHAHLCEDASFLEMFYQEGRIAGLIHHPNVVSVVDVGRDAEGPFLVMDFVAGTSLNGLIRLCRKKNERVPMQVGVAIGIALASGLHAAHEVRDHEGRHLGIIHRDLTPQNVLVAFTGDICITDFGIAKALGGATRTATGVLKGKMSYMAPEQLRFEALDRRADLFALGITLFELLSGERLYKNRNDGDGVRRLLHDGPPDLGELRPDAPPALVNLLFSLLSKEPGLRPDTALEVGDELQQILDAQRLTEERLTLASWVSFITDDMRKEHEESLAKRIATLESSPVVDATGGRRFKPRGVMAAAIVFVLGALFAGAILKFGTSTNAALQMGADPAIDTEPVVLPSESGAAAPSSVPDAGIATAQMVQGPDESEVPEALETAVEPSPMRGSMRRRNGGTRSTKMTDSAGVMWYGW